MTALSDAPDGSRTRAGGAMGLLRRATREPLVHFIVLGAVIFAGIMGVKSLQKPTVTIAAQDINQLVEYWQLQTQRAPNKQELAAIIQGRVDEELLAREAQRLGMDKDDLIIRRRLAQKMSFASEDLGDAQPSTATLRAEYDRTKARYAAAARVTFRHVFFSADRGGDAARAAAVEALAKAQAGVDPAGDPSLLPLTYADADPEALARDYGPDFAKNATTAPLDHWIGPVQSPFGYHLIRVEGRAQQVIPPFEAVQDQVRENYLAEQRQAKNEAFLRKLRQQYRINVAGVSP